MQELASLVSNFGEEKATGNATQQQTHSRTNGNTNQSQSSQIQIRSGVCTTSQAVDTGMGGGADLMQVYTQLSSLLQAACPGQQGPQEGVAWCRYYAALLKALHRTQQLVWTTQMLLLPA